MSIIDSTFEELKNNNSRALVTYTVAGDPDLKESEKIIENIIGSPKHNDGKFVDEMIFSKILFVDEMIFSKIVFVDEMNVVENEGKR